MTYWQDLSDAELRARLLQRGFSAEWVEQAVEGRNTEKWSDRITRLLN
jgi:hypothetical protein